MASLFSFQFVLEPLIELLPQILLFRQARRPASGTRGPSCLKAVVMIRLHITIEMDAIFTGPFGPFYFFIAELIFFFPLPGSIITIKFKAFLRDGFNRPDIK